MREREERAKKNRRRKEGTKDETSDEGRRNERRRCVGREGDRAKDKNPKGRKREGEREEESVG